MYASEVLSAPSPTISDPPIFAERPFAEVFACAVSSLEPHRPSGSDGTLSVALKKLAQQVAPALTRLFAGSLNQGGILND